MVQGSTHRGQEFMEPQKRLNVEMGGLDPGGCVASDAAGKFGSIVCWG